jgi:hypothetical protein
VDPAQDILRPKLLQLLDLEKLLLEAVVAQVKLPLEQVELTLEVVDKTSPVVLEPLLVQVLM